MIDLEEDHLKMVRAILAQYAPDATVWAFGSRVQGRAWKFSDLDLAVDAGSPLTLRSLRELKEAFQESRLPIKVDVLDLCAISNDFRACIEQERERLC